MKKLFLAILALTLIASCSKSDKPESTAEEAKSSTETTKQTPNKRYSIKSGYVIYSAPMGTTQTLYFDDNGAREVSITEVDLGVAKVKNIEIRRDGFSYNYEEGKNEGTKSKWYVPSSVDYSKADSETIERYKIKDLGTEVIAGKTCKKFSAEFGSSPMQTWVWNNIMVKSITKMAGEDFVIAATKIFEGTVDPKLFEIPVGVKFTEI